MSYKAVEVDLDNGVVRPSGPEKLPPHGHGLLMLFPADTTALAQNCAELAGWWDTRSRLSEEESNAFANDIEKGRSELGPPKSAWD